MKNDTIIGIDISTNENFIIKENDRLFNTAIIGPTGSGKASFSLKPMILRDIFEGDCQVILFEPIGDLAEDVYNIANKKNKDILYLSPNNCNVSINPLLENEHIVINELVNVFNTIYADSKSCFKDKCIQLLTNGLRVIKRVFKDNATFTDLQVLVENIDNKGKDMLLKLVENNFTSENFKLASWFAEYYEHNIENDDFIEAKNFIKLYTEDKYISRIMNNTRYKNSIDIDTAISKEKHIIVGGLLDLLRKEKGLAYSSLLLEKIITALYNRENKNKPIYLYINEFSTYINEKLVELLLVNRGLNVGVIIGLQARCQIDNKYQNKVFANVRNLIIHPGLSNEDGKYYSDVFNSMITIEDDNNECKKHISMYTPDDIIYNQFGQCTACIIKDASITMPITVKCELFKED